MRVWGGGGRAGTAVAALAVTQVVGWGTTFYLPAVLGRTMAAGTGLSETLVFGGVTLMLFASALIAPAAGRLLGRHGARPCMVAGSLLLAAGLALLAAAEGPVVFAAAWLILGVAMPFALGQAAMTGIVQIAPNRSRQMITMVLLFSGLSSTASWPVLIWLDGEIGWRASLLVYAAIHAGLCAPLHLLSMPGLRPGRTGAKAGGGPGEASAPAPPVPGAFALAAISFSLSGFVTWGLSLQVILTLQDYGHAAGVAVAVGTLLGPAQVLARGLELAGGHRLGILTVGVIAAAAMPLAIMVLILDGGSVAAAIVFTVGYGLSAGLSSVVRAVAPLRLFGREAYAAVLGRLSLFQNVAFAVAPVTFAAVRARSSSGAMLTMALAATLLALACTALLARRAASGRRAGLIPR